MGWSSNSTSGWMRRNSPKGIGTPCQQARCCRPRASRAWHFGFTRGGRLRDATDHYGAGDKRVDPHDCGPRRQDWNVGHSRRQCVTSFSAPAIRRWRIVIWRCVTVWSRVFKEIVGVSPGILATPIELNSQLV